MDTNKKLKQYIENIEHLEIEKKEITEQITAVYQEAKATGFNTVIIREIIKLRKKDINERQEIENLLEVYKQAIGM